MTWEFISDVLSLIFISFGALQVFFASVGIARFAAAREGKVTIGDFRYEEPDTVPVRARLLNRNYMNLLELPVLFYVVCIVAFVSGVATSLTVGLAWLYVGLRMVHTLVHVMYNDVMHRFAAFAADFRRDYLAA